MLENTCLASAFKYSALCSHACAKHNKQRQAWQSAPQRVLQASAKRVPYMGGSPYLCGGGSYEIASAPPFSMLGMHTTPCFLLFVAWRTHSFCPGSSLDFLHSSEFFSTVLTSSMSRFCSRDSTNSVLSRPSSME